MWGANALTEVAVNEHKAVARKSFILSSLFDNEKAKPIQTLHRSQQARDVITTAFCLSSQADLASTIFKVLGSCVSHLNTYVRYPLPTFSTISNK